MFKSRMEKNAQRKIVKLLLSPSLVTFAEFATSLKNSVASFSRNDNIIRTSGSLKPKLEARVSWTLRSEWDGVSQLFLHIAKLVTTHLDSLEEWFISELSIIRKSDETGKFYIHRSNINTRLLRTAKGALCVHMSIRNNCKHRRVYEEMPTHRRSQERRYNFILTSNKAWSNLNCANQFKSLIKMFLILAYFLFN